MAVSSQARTRVEVRGCAIAPGAPIGTPIAASPSTESLSTESFSTESLSTVSPRTVLGTLLILAGIPNAAMHYSVDIITLDRAVPSVRMKGETSLLGLDSSDDAPKISAAIREYALNIC